MATREQLTATPRPFVLDIESNEKGRVIAVSDDGFDVRYSKDMHVMRFLWENAREFKVLSKFEEVVNV